MFPDSTRGLQWTAQPGPPVPPGTPNTRDYYEPLANLVDTFDYGIKDTPCVSSFWCGRRTQIRVTKAPGIANTQFS